MTARERTRKERRQVTTRKKTKIVGSKTYIDHATGEVRDFQVVSIEERDVNFHKIWLQHVIYSMDIIGNQKTRLAFWLLENMDRDNKIIMTQPQMADATGIGLTTVRETLAALVENNFLVRPYKAIYQVNPDIVFKGGKHDRMGVLLDYYEAKDEDEPPEADIPASNPAADTEEEPIPLGEPVLFPVNAASAVGM